MLRRLGRVKATKAATRLAIGHRAAKAVVGAPKPLAALFLLASAVAAGGTAAGGTAAGEPLSLDYRAYLLGLPLASASARIEIAGDRYRVRGAFESSALVGIFAPWTQEAVSAGQLSRAGSVSAERHWQSGIYKGEARHMDLVYSSERAIVTSAEPDPDGREPEERVPPDITGDTTDALSGLLAVARQVGEGRGCDATVPVFDGRRRYDVTFREGEDGGGPEGAVECRFVVTHLAGFDGDEGLATDPDQPGRIWFRPAADGRPAIPVRLELDTDWGTAVVVLVRVTRESEAAAVKGKRG